MTDRHSRPQGGQMSYVDERSEIEIVAGGRLHALEPDWSSLLERTYDNRIFMSPLWVLTWCRHFGSADARIIISQNASGQLTGLLPLQLSRQGAVRTLALLGDHNVSDYMDALADRSRSEPVLRGLWSTAIELLEWDLVELRHVPSASPLLSAVETVSNELGLDVTIDRDEVCPVALLCNTWDGYLQTLGKKQRHEIRRKLRRATQGTASAWRVSRTTQELERDLPVFFQLHEAGGGEKARFLTTAMRAYFTDLAQGLLERDILRLGLLERDGADVATTLSFRYRDRYFLYNSGYSPGDAARSPGIAAAAFTMQQAIEEQAVAFDFLSGSEPYKYQLGGVDTFTCRVTVTRR